jgi:hypothetical protein
LFAQLLAVRAKVIFLLCAKNMVALARAAYPRTPMKTSEWECSSTRAAGAQGFHPGYCLTRTLVVLSPFAVLCLVVIR